MDPTSSAPPPHGQDPAGPGRAVELVAGDFLLTVNTVDGCEIEPCPPGRRPLAPRRPPAERALGEPPPPPLERQGELRRLTGLLARGRSVRLTGAPGTGRTTVLTAAAHACADLAPDGVIRLDGRRRTAEDLRHELYTAVYRAPGYRPAGAELAAALRETAAVVVVDDLEFGGSALDELLAATPECAFLFSAVPAVPGPATAARTEEVSLAGLSRTGCLELLETAAGHPLTAAETDWAVDLWLATGGLPQSFLRAGALLRLRGLPHTDTGSLPAPDAVVAAVAGALSEAARETLRHAVALGGEIPAPADLAALTGDPRAGAALDELRGAGLLAPAGANHRLASGVAPALAAAGYADDSAARALAAADYYAGRPAAPADADVLLATARAARRAGYAAEAARLARAAAPVLAASTRWGAWERMLRVGAEAARAAGEVAQQAYFHHELGVLALCRGQLERARAELEASTALHGALADAGGTTAGRRALTLVRDLERPARPARRALPPAPSGTDDTLALKGLPVAAPRPALAAAPNGGAPGETAAVGPTPGRMPGPTPGLAADDEETTQVIERVTMTDAGRRRARRPRRNVAAAGAGALLVTVLGAAVTLGLVSQGDDDSEESGNAEPPVAEPDLQQDAEEPVAPADERESRSPEPTEPEPTRPAPTEPADSATEEPAPDVTPGPTDPAAPTTPEATAGESGGSGGSGGSDGDGPGPSPTRPQPTDPAPTDPEPTDPEPTEPEPTEPEPTEPEPTDPEPTDPEPTDPEPTDETPSPTPTETAPGETPTQTPTPTPSGDPSGSPAAGPSGARSGGPGGGY